MSAETPRRLPLPALLIAAASLLPACSTTWTRSQDDPEIDEPALSTRFDREDLEYAMAEWVVGFDRSDFVEGLGKDRPTIAILKVANNTTEHISGALDSLLGSIETRLVQSGNWDVVDNTTLTRSAVLAERVRALGDSVDPETRAALGAEFGIHYFVNGRVYDTTEKTEDVRRVQYYLFLRVTNVATNRIEYQHEVGITKQQDD